jgi:hypothetical protein
MNLLRKATVTLFIFVAILGLLLITTPSYAGLGNLQQQLSQQGIEERTAPSQGTILTEVAARCGGGGGFLQNLFGGIINFFKNIFSNIGSIFSGGGGGIFNGGGNNGGGTCPPPIDDTPVNTTPPGGTATTTPGTQATPPTDVPSGTRELAQEIRTKFGVSMNGNWNEAQLKAVYKTLSVMPKSFRQWNRYMYKSGNRGNLLGLGQIGGEGKIWIYGGAFNANNGTGIGTIVHEMVHNFQGNREVMNLWRSTIERGSYGGMRAQRGSVSSYGNTKDVEDMAESVRHYYLYPAKMKASHPARYKFVKEKIMENIEFSGTEWQ